MGTAYQALISDDIFTANLGKMILSAGKFEVVLKDYIKLKGHEPVGKKTPMGALMKKLQQSQYLGCTVEYHFGFLLDQRNYFVHKIYELLNVHDFQESNIIEFRNRVAGIQNEIDFFTALFLDEIDKNT